MIAFLKGAVSERRPDSIIIDVNGVGYEVNIHSRLFPRLPQRGEPILIHTFLQVLENEFKLFGFLDQDELRLFKTLLSVSGIGSKGALAVLSTMEPLTFYRAIASQDEKTLVRIPGVGKKTAQRMIFELQDKVPELKLVEVEKEQRPLLDELMEALEILGYSRSEILPVIMDLNRNKQLGTSVEENIKLVLKAKAQEMRR